MVDKKDRLMARYQLTSPEGEKFEVQAPNNATEKEVMDYFHSNIQSFKPQEKGFLENVSEDLSKRGEAAVETKKSYKAGDIGLVQGVTQVAGQAAGAVLDVVGEGVVSAAKTVADITPEAIKDPIKKVAIEGWKTLTETDVGKAAMEAVQNGVDAWASFKKENPNAAKTIESATNIALLAAPLKAKANAEPSVLGKTADILGQKAGKQIAISRKEFAGKLISPQKTAKVKVAETARTTEKGVGPFKRSVIELSPREQAVAAEVNKIKEITPRNSIQGNLNIIYSENEKLAKRLEVHVGKAKSPITFSEASQAIDDSVARLVAENPVITGNAETMANKLAIKAKQILSENESTPLGVLRSRKQFDAFIKSQKATAFDPKLENVLSASVRSVRGVMNDLVDSKVTNVGVKRELARQSLLYDAIENIGPKAAEEANYAIGRAIQNMATVLPFRSKFVNEAGAVAGLGIVGASAAFAPIFAAGLVGSVATVKAGKLILGPGMKKNLGKVVTGLDKALITSKNPSMIKQLRADRALVIELMKNSEEEK
jgi:hypothetical protein